MLSIRTRVMRRLEGAGLALALTLALPGPVLGAAERARTVSSELLSGILDDEPLPLPRSRAAGARLPVSVVDPALYRRAPASFSAEYEPSSGLLLRWGAFNDVLTQIVVGVTTGEPDALVYLVVGSPSQQGRAISILEAAGAELGRIRFVLYRTDSAWIRDYGPRRVSHDAGGSLQPLLLDHRYNKRSRARDDGFSDYLAVLWGEQDLDLPLVHAGGNLHVFSDGDAFVTDLLRAENPDLALWELQALFLTLAGIDLTVLPSLPTTFDGTGHVDMWLLPVRDREVIVARYSPRTGAAHLVTEAATRQLERRGYYVHRIPGWRSRRVHYTYTNALVFNDLVFVPVYRGHDSRNLKALETFARAFPGRQLLPIESRRLVSYQGALHCLALHLPRLE